jgi:general secretion pathway protein B
MSFILDALKKSENERQRQVGPSLADVRVVRRNTERPWWVIAVAALLVVNLGVLLVVLIRGWNTKPETSAQQATVPPQSYNQPGYNYNAPPPMQAPPPNYNAYGAAPGYAGQGYAGQQYAPGYGGQPAQQYQQPPAQYQPQPGQYQQPPAPRSYQPNPVPADRSVRPLATEAGAYQEPYPDDAPGAHLAGAANVPEGPPMVRQIQPPSVAALPAGAMATAQAAANPPAGGGALVGEETLPTLDDLVASGTNLPELHLDIHVASQNPAERFVFVNMRKYLEGETLKEGPSIERITPEGVILNQRGLRFLLPRQ